MSGKTGIILTRKVLYKYKDILLNIIMDINKIK